MEKTLYESLEFDFTQEIKYTKNDMKYYKIRNDDDI